MADDAPQSTALAVQQPRQLRTPVEDLVPVFDTNRFEHYGRIATVMARASLVPDSLKGASFDEAQANCFQVAELADRWGYSPFAVAQCASIVYGKLMVEGKLVAAVLASKLGIELNHYYTGEWGKDDYRIFATDAHLTDEQIAALKPHIKFPGLRIVDGSVGEWKTLEKDRSTKGNWKNQPDVQLQYRADRTWARLFQPAIMLGVVTDDEIEAFADRQESRRAPLTAGFGDSAALDNAKRSLVAPMEPAPADPAPQHNPEVVAQAEEPVPENAQVGPSEVTAQESHAEPDPPHAQDASETTAPAGTVYLLRGEAPGDDGKLPTYKDGKPFSRASEKAAGRLTAYDHHAPLHVPEAEGQAVPLAAATSSPAEAAASPASDAGTAEAGTPGTGGPVSDADPPFAPDDAEAEFAEIEPTEDANPMVAAMAELAGANSGREIKDVMGRVTASEAFKAADDTGRMLIRQTAWERYTELHKRGVEDGKVTQDVMFMSLWIEFGATTKQQIDQMWGAFFAGDIYKGLNEGWKRALAQLIAKRKAVLP